MIVQCFERVAVPLGRRVPTARDTEIRAAEPLDFEPTQRLLCSDDKLTATEQAKQFVPRSLSLNRFRLE